jgi:Zn-dependent peptidase ImmA (M78 family)/transcriptional regulator with XRE-family HTH domain
MKPGTPGFIGARLKEAREARGLTSAALSQMLGLSRTAISHYENGDQSPRPEVMERIQQTLNLRPEFFRRLPAPKSSGAVFYRSMSAATKAARVKAERRYAWLREIASYLREFITFPRVNLPVFDVPDDPNKISPELIEEIASETRRYWKLGDGPISNIAWLLENQGVIVSRCELEAETLDAFSEWHVADNTPYIILGSDKNVAVRSRSDAGHELAHLILHRKIDRTRIARSQDFKLIETQAHRFSGAFLLPASAFFREVSVPSLDTFRALKPIWLVSIQMFLYRSQDLGLISKERSARMWANCARRGWRLREPLDDRLPVEQPRLLSRAFQMLIQENVQTRTSMLSALPYSQKDIEDLAGLPQGFFRENVEPIALRGSFSERTHVAKDQGHLAQIVDFKSRLKR